MLRILKRRIFIHVGIKPPVEDDDRKRQHQRSERLNAHKKRVDNGRGASAPSSSAPATPKSTAAGGTDEASLLLGEQGGNSSLSIGTAATKGVDVEKEEEGGHGRKDSTFVVLCKGSCTNGQTGILYDREAENYIEVMKQRDSGEVWVISPQDFVIKGMPNKSARFSALRSRVCVPACVCAPLSLSVAVARRHGLRSASQWVE